MKGEVYRLRRPRETRGHEQQGERYAVVVLATRYSALSRWLVVPTSTSAQPAAFRPEIDIAGTTTRALCDALSAVDPEARFGEQVAYLSEPEIEAIDEALALLLDLPFP